MAVRRRPRRNHINISPGIGEGGGECQKKLLKPVGTFVRRPPVVKSTRVYCSFLLLFVLCCPLLSATVLLPKQIVIFLYSSPEKHSP